MTFTSQDELRSRGMGVTLDPDRTMLAFYQVAAERNGETMAAQAKEILRLRAVNERWRIGAFALAVWAGLETLKALGWI